MSDVWVDQFIAAVKEVAFGIPAPNAHTPLLVELCLAAERIRAEENYTKETARLSGWQRVSGGLESTTDTLDSSESRNTLGAPTTA